MKVNNPAGRLLSVVSLLTIYLLTLGSLAPGDLVIGAILATMMELGWRRRMARSGWAGAQQSNGIRRPPLWRALLASPRLVLVVLDEITRGTWEVAKYSLGVQAVDHDGIIEIEIPGITEEGAATWAFITTISPGELAVDIDEERGILVIHTLDTRNPEAVRAHHRSLYERFQRKVIP